MYLLLSKYAVFETACIGSPFTCMVFAPFSHLKLLVGTFASRSTSKTTMIENELFHQALAKRKISGLIFSSPRLRIHDCFPGVSGSKLLQLA